MKLTRFTVDGEGIFRKLHKLFDEIEMPVSDEQELYEAEETFDMYLEVPDVCVKNKNTRSYFTEMGLEEFKGALEVLQDLSEFYLNKKIEIEQISFEGEVLYKDCYQAVLTR